jgi:predicted nucleic acid-binding protein
MQIVLDSNVLFSALIKNSITRKIILDYSGKFLFPSYIFDEAQKYLRELLEKSGLNEEEFELLFNMLLTKMEVISNEELISYKDEALDLIKDIDIDDVTFIACALANPGSIIWSDDKKLKKQVRIRVVSTEEMMENYLDNREED